MADVLVKERLLRKIERMLDEVLEQREEYISEEEAAKFLGIKVKTLWNHLALGKIPASAYKDTIVRGKRVYLKSKLLKDEN